MGIKASRYGPEEPKDVTVKVNPYSKPQPLPGPYRHADKGKSQGHAYYSDPWDDE